MKSFKFTSVTSLLFLMVSGWGCSSFVQAADREATAAKAEPASFRHIVKQVLPALVNVESYGHSSKVASGISDDEQDFGLPEEFRRFFDKIPAPGSFDGTRPGKARLSSGSGFIVDPKGVIVTNYHVVQGSDQVEVRLKDGRKFTSKNIKSDPKTDLAIIRIDSKEPLPALQWGDSDAMEIGDRVLAVGAPFGLEGTVTQGIVSGKGRSLKLNMYEDFVQTDAAINPGNSGGPLVNLDGKVIGINSVIKTRTGGFQGVGLAISSNLAHQIVEQLLNGGIVKRGYIGVQVRALEPAISERLGLKDRTGVLVAAVFEGTPAAKAGLKEGDVITAINEKPLLTPAELSTTIVRLPVGKSATLNVWRDGKYESVSVMIEQQPEQFGLETGHKPATSFRQGVKLEKIGIEIADLSKEAMEKWSLSERAQGVVIVRVDPKGVAATAGLRTGQVVMKVNGTRVTTTKGAADALAAASLQKGVLFQVYSPDEGVSYVLLRESSEF